MANETVLIVDADAASLKLAAAVLRREGYQIQLSSSGEQALTTLQTDRADLMLVSTALPGISGSELALRAKEVSHNANILVMGLREPVGDDSDRSAMAGFAGCLRKPLDPVELAQSVRDILDCAPDPAPGISGNHNPTSEVDDFRRSFAEDGFRETREMLNALGGSLDPIQAHRTVQDLAGMAQTLGFEDIAERARVAAQALKFYPSHWSKLQGPLTNLMNVFERAATNGQVRVPQETGGSLKGSQIVMIGFPRNDADRLCEALAGAGARVRLFDANESPESDAVRGCALYLVHVRPETGLSPWLKCSGSPLSKTVLVGRIEHLVALDPVVQFGVREFLVDGYRAEEVVLRLARTLKVSAPDEQPAVTAPVRAPLGAQRKRGDVLIVDDDPNVRLLVKTVLENHGIPCRVATNAEEGIALAKEYLPAAALLDVNMPGMSGFEALPKIRAASPGTKVVMLTGREQEADIVKGFSLGSDDYVVKPFIPKELVARLRRLL